MFVVPVGFLVLSVLNATGGLELTRFTRRLVSSGLCNVFGSAMVLRALTHSLSAHNDSSFPVGVPDKRLIV